LFGRTNSLAGSALDIDIPGGDLRHPGIMPREENIKAAAAEGLPPLSAGTMTKINEVYNRLVRPHVHHYW
jgi:hypothetical protein